MKKEAEPTMSQCRGLWLRSMSFKRRLLLLFLAPILLTGFVLAITGVYYYVRILFLDYAVGNSSSRSGSSQGSTLSGGNGLDDVQGEPFSVVRRSDAKARVDVEATPYRGEYALLRPGHQRVNDTVLNPALAGTAFAENAIAHHGAALSRRYLLDGMERGRRYMLRLSYLGSPSVGYRVLLYQIRQSALQKRLAAGEVEEEEEEDAAPATTTTTTTVKSAYVPADTEIRMLAMHATNPMEFDHEEEVWYDVETTASHHGDAEDGTDVDPFLPVVEIRPFVLAICSNPMRFAYVGYNLQLNPLTANVLPDIALPCVASLSFLLIGVGGVLLYPWLCQALSSDEEDATQAVKLHSRDSANKTEGEKKKKMMKKEEKQKAA